MIDAVLGYHMNALTCGVAKFNSILATRLGVPMIQIFSQDSEACRSPLLSIKISEFAPDAVAAFRRYLDCMAGRQEIRVFFHDFSDTGIEHRLLEEAAGVYAGNAELAARLRTTRPDVQLLWAPGTLSDQRVFAPAEITLFSFGMAHKVRAEQYHALKRLLDATGADYRMYISTALHEGTTFDRSFESAYQELRSIFNGSVYFLGYLSDMALYNYISSCDFFCAFFPGGVRANNTSVHAAMETGAIVITNLDQHSPDDFEHGRNLLDIGRSDALPMDLVHRNRIRSEARQTAGRYGWSAFLSRLSELEGSEERLSPAEISFDLEGGRR